MKLKWNPLSRTSHNQIEGKPRVFFHVLPHGIIGAIAAGVTVLAGWPLWVPAVAVLLIAAFLKCSWFDWRRTSGTLYHFVPQHDGPRDWPDIISDIGLGLLFAYCAPFHFGIVLTAGLYYLLSLFNGT